MANSTAIYCLVQQVGQIVGTSGSAAALQQLFRQRLDVNLKNNLPEKAKVAPLFLFTNRAIRHSMLIR